MRMSDGGFMGAMFGAQIVADRIAHEGSMQRRQIDRLHNQAAEVAALRQRDAWLVQKYNQLARDYDQLNAWAKQQVRDLASVRKENAELRARVKELTAKVASLRDLDRQLHPEAHLFDFIFEN
jgi:cell division protein FtsB